MISQEKRQAWQREHRKSWRYNRTRDRKLRLIPALLAALLFIPSLSWASGGATTIDSDQDFVWAIAEVAASASTRFDLDLDEYKDFNGDGDFSDAGETVNVFSITNAVDCTPAASSAHVSCDRFDLANEQMNLVWRNSTSRHRPGNYTFEVQWEDALGSVSAISVMGVRIKDPDAKTSDVTNAQNFLSDQHLSQNTNATTHHTTMTTQHITTNGNLTSHNTNLTDHNHELAEARREILYSDESYFIPDNRDFVYAEYRLEADHVLNNVRITLIRTTAGALDGQVNEDALLSEVSTTGVDCAGGLEGHFSCDVNSGGATPPGINLIWREDSISHVPGNYSFRAAWINGSGEEYYNHTFGITITDPVTGSGDMTTNNIITNPQGIGGDVVSFAILLGSVILLSLFASRPGTYVPWIAIFLSIASLFFLTALTAEDLFPNISDANGGRAAKQILAALPILPVIIGLLSLVRTWGLPDRIRRRQSEGIQ